MSVFRIVRRPGENCLVPGGEYYCEAFFYFTKITTTRAKNIELYEKIMLHGYVKEEENRNGKFYILANVNSTTITNVPNCMNNNK